MNKKVTKKEKTTTPSRPTTAARQKKVLALLGENGGSFRQAIKAAGYSQKYADNPQKLLNTRTWKEIIDQALPNEFLAMVHNQLLQKEEVVVLKSKDKIEIIRTGEMDVAAVTKGLDMAYKLKGHYKDTIDEEERQSIITKIVIMNPYSDEQKIKDGTEKESFIQGLLDSH